MEEKYDDQNIFITCTDKNNLHLKDERISTINFQSACMDTDSKNIDMGIYQSNKSLNKFRSYRERVSFDSDLELIERLLLDVYLILSQLKMEK